MSPLDKIKFICKDLWPTIYNRPIDNLKTNHKGIFLLEDYLFKPFILLSSGGETSGKNLEAGPDAMMDGELAQKSIPVSSPFSKFPLSTNVLVSGMALWSHSWSSFCFEFEGRGVR